MNIFEITSCDSIAQSAEPSKRIPTRTAAALRLYSHNLAEPNMRGKVNCAHPPQKNKRTEILRSKEAGCQGGPQLSLR